MDNSIQVVIDAPLSDEEQVRLDREVEIYRQRWLSSLARPGRKIVASQMGLSLRDRERKVEGKIRRLRMLNFCQRHKIFILGVKRENGQFNIMDFRSVDGCDMKSVDIRKLSGTGRSAVTLRISHLADILTYLGISVNGKETNDEWMNYINDTRMRKHEIADLIEKSLTKRGLLITS